MINFLKNNYTSLSTTLFVLIILIAHIFSTNGYDWTKNTISQLGAQGYSRKYIMQIGFLTFGIVLPFGIILNGLSWRTTPILIYGLCVGLTGVFCTKPFYDIEYYSLTQANIHSALAQIAGVTFTLGILFQLFHTTNKGEKWTHFTFLLLVVVLSASFGYFKNYEGIAQRLLYLISFIWLINYFKH